MDKEEEIKIILIKVAEGHIAPDTAVKRLKNMYDIGLKKLVRDAISALEIVEKGLPKR